MLGRVSSLMPLKTAPQRQQGLTLIELMIGLLVGLIVVSGVLTVYLAVISSSSGTLKSSKLNLEMGSIMSVMVNDIRRAGTWPRDFGSSDPLLQAQNNPYAQPSSAPAANDGTALEIHDSMSAANDANLVTTTNGTATNLPDIYVPNGTGSCIVYSYDSDSADSGLQNSDLFGFRLNGTAVEMRDEGDMAGDTNSCTNGVWGSMNDTNTVNITALEFDLEKSTCLVSNEPNGLDENDTGGVDDDAERNCYVTSPYSSKIKFPSETYVTTEARVVTIRLEGELVGDPDVKAELKQTVRVRNDLLRKF